MPLRKHAEEMRDLYAVEIAAARAAGQEPSAFHVASFEKYAAAARSSDPAATLMPATPTTLRARRKQ